MHATQLVLTSLRSYILQCAFYVSLTAATGKIAEVDRFLFASSAALGHSLVTIQLQSDGGI